MGTRRITVWLTGVRERPQLVSAILAIQKHSSSTFSEGGLAIASVMRGVPAEIEVHDELAAGELVAELDSLDVVAQLG